MKNNNRSSFSTGAFVKDLCLSAASLFYDVIGAHSKMVETARRQLAHRLANLSSDHLEVARAQFDLADQLLAGTARDRAEALGLLNTSRPVFEDNFGECSNALGQVIRRLAMIKDRDGDTQSAEALYRQAFTMFTHHAPSWSSDYAQVCERLAGILEARGDKFGARGFADIAKKIHQRRTQVMLSGRYAYYYMG
ncbi:MAG TPA: hypothetical protein V6C72_02195 [Chroococcales cyanobacterium]